MTGLRVEGVERVQRHLTDQRLVSVPLSDMLRTASKEAEDYAKNRVRSLQSVADSLHSESRGLHAAVFSTHPAALHVEVGRRPGTMPPSAKLVAWALKRGIPRGALFVISRAIARRGIRGRYFMRGAKSRMKTRWRQYLRAAAKDIERRWKS